MMKRFAIGIACLMLVLSVGCGKSKPKRVEGPAVDPESAAAKAMELYDTDKNGKIEKTELDATPALKYALSYMDKNADGGLDKAEIANQMKLWVESKIGLTTPALRFVAKGNKPAKGTKATLTPEAFLPGLKTAEGTITKGACAPSSAGNVDGLPGMTYGFYTITIDAYPNKKWGVEISSNNEIARKASGNYTIEVK